LDLYRKPMCELLPVLHLQPHSNLGILYWGSIRFPSTTQAEGFAAYATDISNTK